MEIDHRQSICTPPGGFWAHVQRQSQSGICSEMSIRERKKNSGGGVQRSLQSRHDATRLLTVPPFFPPQVMFGSIHHHPPQPHPLIMGGLIRPPRTNGVVKICIHPRGKKWRVRERERADVRFGDERSHPNMIMIEGSTATNPGPVRLMPWLDARPRRRTVVLHWETSQALSPP